MSRTAKRYGYTITIEKRFESGDVYRKDLTCWDEAEKDDCLNLAEIYDYKVISIKPFVWFDYRQNTPYTFNWKRDA